MIQQTAAVLRRAGWLALLALLASSATACGGSDDSASEPQPQPFQLALAGELSRPATVSLAELQALPVATQRRQGSADAYIHRREPVGAAQPGRHQVRSRRA